MLVLALIVLPIGSVLMRLWHSYGNAERQQAHDVPTSRCELYTHLKVMSLPDGSKTSQQAKCRRGSTMM